MPKPKSSRRHLYKKHVHSRLLIQLRIYAGVSVVMAGIVLYDIWQGAIGWSLALLGIVIGLVVGFIVGKLYGIRWHEDTQKIVTRMDAFGVAVIVLYVGFSIFRRQLFSQFIHGPALTAMTFSSVGGVMTGRLLAITDRINKMLKEQKIF